MPSEPATDDTKSDVIELEVVPYRVGDGTPGPGRPLFLTARRFLGICKLIENGASATEACRRALVSYQGFRKHVQKNEKYQRRLKEAEMVREHWLREYHIANIVKHAPRNVLASLWWLERRYPAEFALRTVNRDNGQSDQLVGDRIPEERLQEYGRILAEHAREEEARKAAQQPAGDQAALPDSRAEAVG